jgi:hypothetical protein
LTALSTVWDAPERRGNGSEQDELILAVPTDDATAADRYKYITRYVMAVLYFSTGGGSWEEPDSIMSKRCNWNMRFFNGYTLLPKGCCL